MHSEQRTLQHLQMQLAAAEQELDRKANIISGLVDELYRSHRNPIREEPTGVEHWRAA